MKTMERVKGIEPSYSAWKAAALPLSYTRDGLAHRQINVASSATGILPDQAPKYRVFLSGGILSVKAAFCGVAPVILEQEGKGSLSIVPSREMFGGG